MEQGEEEERKRQRLEGRKTAQIFATQVAATLELIFPQSRSFSTPLQLLLVELIKIPLEDTRIHSVLSAYGLE